MKLFRSKRICIVSLVILVNTVTLIVKTHREFLLADDVENHLSDVRDFYEVPDQLVNNNSSSIEKDYLSALPDFERNGGGLVVFYHVAKTGGSTIRSLFQKVSQEKPSQFSYRRISSPFRDELEDSTNIDSSDGEMCLPPGIYPQWPTKVHGQFQRLLSNNFNEESKEKTTLLEIHGGSPGLRELLPLIKEWREMSKSNNKPFFAFTTIREPVSYAKSYFKQFHLNCEHDWCEQDKYEDATEENLLMSTQLNRQCFLLNHASSVAGMKKRFYEKCKVTEDDCKDILKAMEDNLDWIGTTERLSKDTIPLLLRMFGFAYDDVSTKNKTIGRNEKVSEKLPYEKSLDESKVLALSPFDQAMYARIKSEYTLSDDIL